jgi:hypothetical protein
MAGACCISSVNPPLGICAITPDDVTCNETYGGIYLGEDTVCPASGSCIVSPAGIINDCEWCCGCNQEGEPKRQFYPCCFRTTDGLCDCPQAHSIDYINTCSGRAKGDCDIEGFTKLRSDLLGDPAETETIEDCYIDARIPRACCHMVYDNLNVPLGITCSNVCNPRECDLKNTTNPSTYPSVYSSGAVCGKAAMTKYPSAYNCGLQVEGIVGASQRRYSSNNIRQERVGTCFTLQKRGDEYYYKCEPGFKDSCKSNASIFVPMKDSRFDFCYSDYAPKRPQFTPTGVLLPQTMSTKDFRELTLNFGDFYQGGYFIGIFSPNSADVYGSELTSLNSKQRITKSEVEGVGSVKSLSNKKWALFMDDTSTHTSLYASSESFKPLPRLSRYDGFYNTHGTEYSFAGLDAALVRQSKKIPHNGQIDWYIPSVNELKFLFSKLVISSSNYYTFINKLYNIGNNLPVFYTSSGINPDYLYGGIMDFANSEIFGKILPIHKSSRQYIKKFRKIELVD